MPSFRHPAVAVSHGPGPLWLVSSGFDDMMTLAIQLLSSLFSKLYPKDENLPKRILFVSAHWESESSGFEISDAAKPDMIYDYYGFPDEAYDVMYPAKGDPAFAQQLKDQLEKCNIMAKLVDRGFDQGSCRYSLSARRADIPIVTMSIKSNLSNQDHYKLGKALASFRYEDTLIMCSGQSTRGHPRRRRSKLSVNDRANLVMNWHEAPAARLAHPSPDHFLPFVVAAEAGMEEKEPGAKAYFGGWAIGHLSFAIYVWGVQQQAHP